MPRRALFQQARLEILKIDRVDCADRTFAVSWPSERNLEELTDQIKSSGAVNPVWVQEKEQVRIKRPVHGFRRLTAARKAGFLSLPALVFDKAASEIELFRARLAGHGWRLSAVEAAKVIERLEKRFSVKENELTGTFLPLLGLGASPRQLAECRRIGKLEDPAACFCAENRVGLKEAALWAAFSGEDQQAILELVQAVTPGGNLLRRYLELLREITARENLTVKEILARQELSVKNLDPQVSRSGWRERVHKTLREIRYPVYKQIQERFTRASRLLGLPKGVNIEPPPFFEGERLTVSFEIRSAEELAQKARSLVTASGLDTARELFYCLGAPEEEPGQRKS
ncbi:MAG TPA: ParB N-terminal domain-containing protein [archaeon]|nr:ParB N-terminal domain-containing protein [archaeon]